MFWRIVRFSTAAVLVILPAFVFIFAGDGDVRVAQGHGMLLQGTPGYDAPTEDSSGTDPGNGYNAPATDTPGAIPTQIFSSPSPEITATETVTATIPPDVFRTEDSEINQSMTTPVVTETPEPTITKYVTPTVIKTQRQGTPTPPAAREKAGFSLDWGMFLAGFVLPVLAACGYILYLMDHRPELFKRFRR